MLRLVRTRALVRCVAARPSALLVAGRFSSATSESKAPLSPTSTTTATTATTAAADEDKAARRGKAVALARRILTTEDFNNQMFINRSKMAAAKEHWRRHEADVGSPEVQVAMLTERVRYLTEHMKTHRKDMHNVRGLKQILSKRRKNLLYLERTNPAVYAQLLEKLNIRVGTGDERVTRKPVPLVAKKAAGKAAGKP